ncbi:hypothetical protein ACGFX4_06705 [Kitasatospora sp. NPDC048365]|uniref:hypothetical protein n=1 Tax=Kitasatospora sp. NPDC048365 TaxID=3364050 RepID=UPI0037129DF1
MLAEELAALAAAGGTAVVQAAGTSAWAGLRNQVARWFGRDDADREQATLVRLDETASALAAVAGDDGRGVAGAQEGRWQGRFENELENLDRVGRDRAVDELRALLRQLAQDLPAAARTVDIRFHHNEVGGPVTIVTGDHNRTDVGDGR